MAQFKVRKHGNDLADNIYYNQWNGEYNPAFPEDAPSSVDGHLSSKGNCTWYCWGRMAETKAFNPLPKRPMYRGNASEWGTHGEKLSDKAQVGGIVVFGDGGFGHVAFIEKIDGNDVIVSESAYSTRGNDFLFRYGRTVKQICNEWNMEVLRYLAPLVVCTSVDSGLVEQDGKFTVTVAEGLNVRKAPSIKAERITGLSKGQFVIDAEGYRWVSWIHNGVRVYAARRTLDNKEIYGTATDVEEVNNPSVPLPNKAGQILVVRDSFPRAKFTAYEDKACKIPLVPWTIANYSHNLSFKIVEDFDPVFKCVQYGKTPMSGVSHVYIKYEPGIGFDKV